MHNPEHNSWINLQDLNSCFEEKKGFQGALSIDPTLHEIFAQQDDDYDDGQDDDKDKRRKFIQRKS